MNKCWMREVNSEKRRSSEFRPSMFPLFVPVSEWNISASVLVQLSFPVRQWDVPHSEQSGLDNSAILCLVNLV